MLAHSSGPGDAGPACGSGRFGGRGRVGPGQGERERPAPGRARMRPLTELFWHWTLELLKRRAGTRWTAPWMLRTHS